MPPSLQASLFYARGGIGHRHAPDLLDRETIVQQPLREHSESFRHRWIDGLPEVGGNYTALHAGLPDRCQYRSPRRFTRVHRRKAMLDESAHPRSRINSLGWAPSPSIALRRCTRVKRLGLRYWQRSGRPAWSAV